MSTGVPPTVTLTLATANVFSDGATLETPTVTGSVTEGYELALTIGIAG